MQQNTTPTTDTRRVVNILSIALLLCSLLGCVSTQPGASYAVKTYSGTAQPVDDVAIVKAIWPLYFIRCNDYDFGIDLNKFYLGLYTPWSKHDCIAVQPGESTMEAFAFADYPDNCICHSFLVSPIEVKCPLVAGRRYAIFNSWIVSNTTESISDGDLCFGLTSSRDGIALHGSNVTVVPTILDVTTEDDVRGIVGGQYDWRIRRAALIFCSDRAFLQELYAREPRAEVRSSLENRIKQLESRRSTATDPMRVIIRE